jgi:hypothetical protein
MEKKELTYGRKFRNSSGQIGRYVYKHRKKIGFVALLAIEVSLPDTERKLKQKKKSGSYYRYFRL